MATIPEALAIAIQHHQAGRLQAAEQIYCQILQLDPRQPDALHLMGVLAHHTGRAEVAVELIQHAIKQHGTSPEFHYNLGGAYSSLGKVAEATACYRRVIGLKPSFAEAHYNLGNSLKEQSQIDEAMDCFRRALQLKPGFVEALFNLAVTSAARGQFADAVTYYQQVLGLKPDDVQAMDNLANLLTDMNRADEAIALYHHALELNSNNAIVHYRLAHYLQRNGLLDEAVHHFHKTLELRADHAEAHGSLGTVLKLQGHLDQALSCYQRAIQLQPQNAALHNNLGLLLQEQGSLLEAIASFYRAAELKPDHAEAYSNLGNALREKGVPAEAVFCYQRVLELKPNDADTFNKLGNALRDLTRLEEAIAYYRQAVQQKPDFAEAFNNLGNALKESGQMCEAVNCYQRAIDLKPDFAVAMNNLGVVLNGLGRHDESIASYRQALAAQPDYAGAHSNLLMTLQYIDGVTLSTLADAHAEFNRRHALPLNGPAPARRPASDRLRVGFFSGDFGRHPVGYFLINVFEQLPALGLELICYSQRVVKDDFTERFQRAAVGWHDVTGLSDERLADQIRADQIDILIDLAGHTARNRLLVFARRPAPIQIAWIGYEGTTGLTAMDYLIADQWMVPPEFEKHYAEKILRMPEGYVCYEPAAGAPDVAPLPMLTRENVTFGSFNNPAKLTSSVIEVWSRLLNRLSEARLVLKYRGLTEPAVKQHFLDAFAKHGISPNRIDILPQSSYADYLATYGTIDVALDPFPFTGGATTCEALWMGVPVITCPGETFAGRHTLSHLHNVALSELAAANLDQYIELAAELASDQARLAKIRSELRPRMAASPLCDAPRFAMNLSALLHDVWQRAD